MERENLEAGLKLNETVDKPMWFLTFEGKLAQSIVDRKDSQFRDRLMAR